MLNIGLIGAPGSKKSETAHAVFEKYGDGIAVIDNYPAAVSNRFDLVAGLEGDYVVNLAIALDRVALERQSNPDVLITCGTLLETSVYTAMSFEGAQEFQSDAEKIDATRRIEATMKTLACLYMDSFPYDLLFYLPMIQQTTQDSRWPTFDRNLQVAFQAFDLVSVVPLIFEGDGPEGIIEQRADAILTAIKEKHEGSASGD